MLSAREPGVIAGLDLAEAAFRLVGDGVRFERRLADGDAVDAGGVVAEISGPARLVMSAERVALNFLNRLSGIATLTRRYAEAVEGSGARICDTRKTTPGLRAFEKYAVRCGGVSAGGGWRHLRAEPCRWRQGRGRWRGGDRIRAGAAGDVG